MDYKDQQSESINLTTSEGKVNVTLRTVDYYAPEEFDELLGALYDMFLNSRAEDWTTLLSTLISVLSPPIQEKIILSALDSGLIEAVLDQIAQNLPEFITIQLYTVVVLLTDYGRPFTTFLSESNALEVLVGRATEFEREELIEITLRILFNASEFQSFFQTQTFLKFLSCFSKIHLKGRTTEQLLLLFDKIINEENHEYFVPLSIHIFGSWCQTKSNPVYIQSAFFKTVINFVEQYDENAADFLIQQKVPRLICRNFQFVHSQNHPQVFKLIQNIADSARIPFAKQINRHLFEMNIEVYDETISIAALKALAAVFDHEELAIDHWFDMMRLVIQKFLSGSFAVKKAAMLVINNVVVMSTQDIHRQSLAIHEVIDELVDVFLNVEEEEASNLAETIILHLYDYGDDEMKEFLDGFISKSDETPQISPVLS